MSIRLIASCVAFALAVSAAQGVVVTNTSQTSVFTVASNDLLQTDLLTSTPTGAFNNFATGGLPVLTDGSGGANATNSFPTSAIPSTNASVVYALNTTANPLGYRITSIDTYGEWDDGRDRQDIAIAFSTVASPAVFTNLASYSFEPPGPSPNFSRVRVTPNVGDTFLADNVAAVRFSFPNQENGGGGYRELDVLGVVSLTLTPPVPGPVAVPLQNATALGSQGGFPVGNLLDNNAVTGWADDLGGITPSNTAVFETVADVVGGGVFTFDFTSGGFGQHVAGRFRLSVTGDDRSTFADGLANGGDVTANWTVLDPTMFSSSNGTTVLTELGDMSILASGGISEFETYTIKATSPLGTVTGFRLEMIEDPSLPNNGPGRAGNGNFVIYNFNVSHLASAAVPEPASALLLVMSAAGLLRRRQRA